MKKLKVESRIHSLASIRRALRTNWGNGSERGDRHLENAPGMMWALVPVARGADVSYNDPNFPFLGHGRHYDLNLTCAPLDHLSRYDCVLIMTDHSGYDYARIARESKLVIDTSNATRNINFPNVVHC